LRGAKSPASSSIVIGSAVHLGASRVLKGEDPGTFFEDAVLKHEEDGGIDWEGKDTPSGAKTWAEFMLHSYWERIGKYLDVASTEQEILVEVPGVDIPILGYVDIELESGSIVDIKTTGYFKRSPTLNPEWKLQMNIYQIEYPDPGEFHILTRSKGKPVVLPASADDPLFVHPPDVSQTLDFVRQTFSVLKHYWEEWGSEVDWPGNLVHPWAAKYCGVERCCQR